MLEASIEFLTSIQSNTPDKGPDIGDIADKDESTRLSTLTKNRKSKKSLFLILLNVQGLELTYLDTFLAKLGITIVLYEGKTQQIHHLKIYG